MNNYRIVLINTILKEIILYNNGRHPREMSSSNRIPPPEEGSYWTSRDHGKIIQVITVEHDHDRVYFDSFYHDTQDRSTRFCNSIQGFFKNRTFIIIDEV